MATVASAQSFADWAEVVAKIRRGDDGGVEDLYAALSKGVCGQLLRGVDVQHASDRLHEILVIVLEAIRRGELREPQRLMGFVRTVARRRLAAHIRSTAFQRRNFVAVDGSHSRVPLEQSPEAHIRREERLHAMMNVLRRLKQRDREILERFYLREQTPVQICREMSLTETQFRLYKSRALAKCLSIAQKKAAGLTAPGYSESRTS